MIFSVLTLFPGIFTSPLEESILKKAVDRGVIRFNIVNIRDFAEDIHRTCDDSPYGGGPGMVMKVDPIATAIEHIEKTFGRPKYILMTPQGRVFDQDSAKRFARLSHVCFICGRYEGVDERVLSLVDEELSIGDFVLSGGEIPALAVIEAVSRLIPGVLGNAGSIDQESHKEPLLEYPHYTRPPVYQSMEVPATLLSGNHEEIRKWRRKESIRRTMLKRPDLMDRFEPNDEDKRLIRQILEEFPE